MSPDGKFIVRVIESNCGVPCSFSTTVLLSDLEQYPDRPRPRTTILTGKVHPCDVVPRWEDARTLVLVVYSAGRVDLNLKRSEWEGVSSRVEEREVTEEERKTVYGTSVFGNCYSRWFIQR